MMTVLSSVFFFLLALGVLITVHEFGHYWVARKVGVKVLRFSIGFGKPLWARQYGPDNTEYVLAAIPLGGYVRMLDEREGEVAPAEAHRAFNRQSLAKRSAIVAAGPAFNFILAIIAYWAVFIIGVAGMKPVIGTVTPGSVAERSGLGAGEEIVRIGDRHVTTWESVVIGILDGAMENGMVTLTVKDPKTHTEQPRRIVFDGIPEDLNRGGLLDYIGVRPYRPAIAPVIGQLAPGGAADKAGLETGDRIISIDGHKLGEWEELVDYVRERPGIPLALVVERGGQKLNINITPTPLETREGNVGRIGAGVQLQDIPKDLIAYEKYGVAESLWQAAVKTWDISVLTLRMMARMVVGDVSLSNLSGPISIARYAGYSASFGIASFLAFLAIISISLGVLNLLPVPMLDGGHLMYYLVELFKGSPLSDKAQIIGQKIGIAALLGMMVLAFYNDILRLFVKA